MRRVYYAIIFLATAVLGFGALVGFERLIVSRFACCLRRSHAATLHRVPGNAFGALAGRVPSDGVAR